MGIIKTQQEFIGKSKRSGIPKGLQRISFCDYLRNFYSVKQIEIEPSSFNGYQNILENHIYPYFNKRNTQFLSISSDEINTYLSYKLNNGFSSSTVKKHREVMGQALRSAFEKGWITDDIMSSVTNIVPDNSEKSIKSIPPDLLDSVLSFAEETDIYVPVMLSVRYGLDRAEILGLRWSDIDAEKREINIRNVVIKGSVSAYDIHPAAEDAIRTLPAFDDDLAILENEHTKQIELRKNNSISFSDGQSFGRIFVTNDVNAVYEMQIRQDCQERDISDEAVGKYVHEKIIRFSKTNTVLGRIADEDLDKLEQLNKGMVINRIRFQ